MLKIVGFMIVLLVIVGCNDPLPNVNLMRDFKEVNESLMANVSLIYNSNGSVNLNGMKTSCTNLPENERKLNNLINSEFEFDEIVDQANAQIKKIKALCKPLRLFIEFNESFMSNASLALNSNGSVNLNGINASCTNLPENERKLNSLISKLREFEEFDALFKDDFTEFQMRLNAIKTYCSDLSIGSSPESRSSTPEPIDENEALLNAFNKHSNLFLNLNNDTNYAKGFITNNNLEGKKVCLYSHKIQHDLKELYDRCVETITDDAKLTSLTNVAYRSNPSYDGPCKEYDFKSSMTELVKRFKDGHSITCKKLNNDLIRLEKRLDNLYNQAGVVNQSIFNHYKYHKAEFKAIRAECRNNDNVYTDEIEQRISHIKDFEDQYMTGNFNERISFMSHPLSFIRYGSHNDVKPAYNELIDYVEFNDVEQSRQCKAFIKPYLRYDKTYKELGMLGNVNEHRSRLHSSIEEFKRSYPVNAITDLTNLCSHSYRKLKDLGDIKTKYGIERAQTRVISYDKLNRLVTNKQGDYEFVLNHITAACKNKLNITTDQ